jgi:subtilase-type serine protease
MGRRRKSGNWEARGISIPVEIEWGSNSCIETLRKCRDGFTETGGVAALSGADASSNIGYSSLGVRLASDLILSDGSVMTPHMSLAWQHAFGDMTPAVALAFAGIAGSDFTVTGVPLASDELLLDLGAELRVSETLSFGVVSWRF